MAQSLESAASKGRANTGIALGSALGGTALLGQLMDGTGIFGGLFNGCGCNGGGWRRGGCNGCGGNGIAAGEAAALFTMGGPTTFQAWEKSCDDAVALTSAIWQGRVTQLQESYAHRETDVAEKHGLYVSIRDLYDTLNERYSQKFNDLDKQVAVLAATRPLSIARLIVLLNRLTSTCSVELVV